MNIFKWEFSLNLTTKKTTKWIKNFYQLILFNNSKMNQKFFFLLLILNQMLTTLYGCVKVHNIYMYEMKCGSVVI